MPTNVVMPQMGESIAEGTIVRWIKKIGDEVDRDEPLFEISTDKVDAEIPSPAAGVLTDIRVKEGETVAVNSVVAVIGGASDPTGARASAEPSVPQAAVGQPETAAKSRSDRGQGGVKPAPERGPAAGKPPAEENRAGAVAEHELEEESDAEPPSTDDLRRQKSSPLVRRIAKEHDVDLRLLKGTGISGRVTKQDILGFIESGATATRTVPAGPRKAPAGPVYGPGENVSVVPMSVMRKKIAEHMVLSAHTSPHVYAVYEVNFGRVAALRERRKADYEAAGARLTYTAIIAKVIVDALRQFPNMNASIDGDNVVYKKDINLGIAVALDNGLIVPVIKNADEKNLLGLSRAINDLAARARAKKLNPDEVQHGTFTITNPGVFGALYGLPLINQPQVGILGVGAIEKRPIVIDDAIAIRPVCNLSLGHDHRLIDGADAGRFLSFVKERLEKFEEGWL
jgi:pyruvate dehydrogenase E2 component (dihydrolipoyllysine-residue acetyltransferase)